MGNKMTAARAIVEVMKREGVEKAFCVPGESYLSVMDAMYDSNIELISGRQEGGVSFMAEAYAKASGKVGVCLATRGPGATNLSIGLHTAHQDSTPVVAFIGQVESYFLKKEGFQEIDMAAYFSHIVKWTVEIREPERVPELVHRAFHVARSGRPGPVLVSLPEDILDLVAEMHFSEAAIYSRPRPAVEAVKQAYELVKSAKKPLIIAGGGVTHTKSAARLVELAEKLSLPVATAFRRFDAFPNDHDHYIGSLGLSTPSYLLEAIKEADVVLALGTRFSQVTSQDYSLLKKSTKLIHVDISEEEINKVYHPTLGIVSDVATFIDDLLQTAEEHADRTNEIAKLRADYVKFSTPKKAYTKGTVDLEGIMYDLNEHLANNAILTSDAGNFFGWMYRYYSFREEGTYVGPTSGAMGYGLPGAIGAKIAQKDRPVVAFAGDGGTMMTIQEFETAVRYQVPVIFVVVNNNMYGTIRMHQEKNFPERVIATKLTNPDFVQFAKSLGANGVTITDNESFLPSLNEAMQADKPTIIELITDPERITATATITELRNK